MTTEQILQLMAELSEGLQRLASVVVQLARQAEQDDYRIKRLDDRVRDLEQSLFELQRTNARRDGV